MTFGTERVNMAVVNGQLRENKFEEAEKSLNLAEKTLRAISPGLQTNEVNLIRATINYYRAQQLIGQRDYPGAIQKLIDTLSTAKAINFTGNDAVGVAEPFIKHR